MFNLAEILTLIIGCLLALVFIDGVRRAIRIKRSKLKVDLIDTSSERDVDFEEEWQGYETQSADTEMSDEIQMLDSLEEEKDPVSNINLNIIHLHDENGAVFSESSLSQALVFYNFKIEEKGIFTILDSDNAPAFSILNGKNPGIFSESVTSNDIALVLDPMNLSNPVEAFELFIEVSQSLKETFQCNILDEDRNFMTKQMIEHMKHQFHEQQRQFLASAS
jgi:FtsZ-interacting cell division protein ZipA|tara:strand:- start:5883 stop:6545 length:663 start_codon:yes stop_codon:yes gene_type:complete